MSKKNVTAIVLARGGSKGLPGKNIRPLLGHPLMEYTIAPLKQAKLIDRIIVSTDDEKIAAVARKLGAEAFIRPAEFSQDDTTSEASLQHAIHWLKKNEDYDVDILFYTQIPDLFKQGELFDKLIALLLEDESLDSAFVGFPDKKRYWQQTSDGYLCLTPVKHGSRQTRSPVYREDTGLGCATRARLIVEEERRLGDKVKILPKEDPLIDIHEECDFWLAEQVLLKQPAFQKYRLDQEQ